MKALLLTTILLATACTDPFSEAKTAGTVEAYETFIKTNASSSRVFDAEMAIEKLMVGGFRNRSVRLCSL